MKLRDKLYLLIFLEWLLGIFCITIHYGLAMLNLGVAMSLLTLDQVKLKSLKQRNQKGGNRHDKIYKRNG